LRFLAVSADFLFVARAVWSRVAIHPDDEQRLLLSELAEMTLWESYD
jgi:hypothetical protein